VQLAAAAFAVEDVVLLLELVTLLLELAVPLEDEVLTLLLEVVVAASPGLAATDATARLSAPAISRRWARQPKRCDFIGRTRLPW